MVSIKDIASSCGVSIATVSKALNGHRDVSDETRERVCRAAEELGYLANASARALKTNRSYNIGVLFVDERSSGLAHEYFSAVLDSLRVEAEANGYDITFINRTVAQRPTTYLQHCLYRGVDGVVIASVDFHDPMVVELVESEIPVVTIDHVFNNRIAIMSDNVHGMEQLVRYVVGKGHRKLAFIHGERTTVTESRLVGFHRACEELGVVKGVSFQCCPSALIYRRSIAKDVLGTDDPAEVISPKLTTWRQSTTGLGREAAARLIELIEHPRTTLIDRQIVSGRLWEGESVKDLNSPEQEQR